MGTQGQCVPSLLDSVERGPQRRKFKHRDLLDKQGIRSPTGID